MPCLYSPICVRPGRKPKLLVFPCTGSFSKEYQEKELTKTFSSECSGLVVEHQTPNREVLGSKLATEHMTPGL